MWGEMHMNRGGVGEERGGKETNRCPLTLPLINDLIHQLKGTQYFTKLTV
jgi:hypothetical protein